MCPKASRPHYLSYLLRLWETRDDDEQVWRASLECPGTGKRLSFGSLAALVAYLEQQIGEQGEGAEKLEA
jgi:hypothetical protein